jgi:Rieske Fe-S protein
MRLDGGLRAVYRDEDGGLQIVSATCAHMGCIVAFNDAERTWECPCHGSRYATSGAVLQGPTTKPLEPHPHH